MYKDIAKEIAVSLGEYEDVGDDDIATQCHEYLEKHAEYSISNCNALIAEVRNELDDMAGW